MSESRAVRAWGVASILLLLVGLDTRVHNAIVYPALRDFDGAGHALNVFALTQGELPHPRSWSGFHPPLAHAIGALLWQIAPDDVPVHTLLRLLSALCGALAIGLVWRTLRPRFAAADVAVVATLLWCAPVTAIATSMIGNEMVCAFFTTAALAWLLTEPKHGIARHALVAGILTGLAVLSKSTALLAVPAVALHYTVALRQEPRRAALAVAIAVAAAGLLAAPHFGRLMLETDRSPLAVVSGGAASPDARAAMALQPPGVRHASDYFWFPSAALLGPIYLDPALLRSVPGLLYASTWADGHAQLLPPAQNPAILRAESVLAIAGLVPTGLALWGLVGIARDRERRAQWAGPLAFGALLTLAFLRYTWTFPQYAAVKASYFLPAMLPVALALAVGLEASGRARAGLRAFLLAIAAASSALLFYGWWTP